MSTGVAWSTTCASSQPSSAVAGSSDRVSSTGRVQPDAGDQLTVGADERRGRAVGVQHVPGLAEDVEHDLVQFHGGAHRLGEPVQPFEVEVSFGEGGVGPEGQQEEDAERHEQPGGLVHWRPGC